MSKKESQFSLRLPASLKAALQDMAREDGTSLNQFLVMAAAEKLSALKTAEAFVSERRDRANIQEALALLSREGGEEPGTQDTLA